MAIRWQIKFKSLLDTDYVLSIYDASYTGGTVTQLTGSAKPFTTSEDDDEDFYVPIRTQSGYVRFIAENTTILGELMPTMAISRPVVLRNGADEVCWVGFLSGEQYSQPWEPCPYEVEVPVVSVMEAMQGVEFTQGEGYTSLLDLMNTIGNYTPVDIYCTAPEDIPLQNVCVQNNCFRDYLTIAERAERSTSDIYECKTLYDCVEAFCTYFGISLREYCGHFYLAVCGGVSYEDIDTNGNSIPSEWAGSESLTDICGDDNQCDYSKAYRRIVGTFSTERDKAEKIYASPDSFLKEFSINGAYPSGSRENLLFNGNSEVKPYKNGWQQASWMNEGSTDTGGQIIRHRNEGISIEREKGSAWSDYFYIRSRKERIATPQPAIKFNIPRKVYINAGEYAALNINCKVDALYTTQSGDFIKRLQCKVKVGNYWLMSQNPGSVPSYTSYSWTTSESSCWLLINGGSVTLDKTLLTLDYRAVAMMDSVSGFAIDMPSGLSAGYHDVYFELLANAENTSDFGEYAAIDYLVSNLELNILRGTNSVTQPTPDLDQNTIIRTLSGYYRDDYTVDSIITTKRGVQFGAGVALSKGGSYITVKYDEQGIARRMALLATPREILTVDTRKRIHPTETFTFGNSKYAILSQSINWRDDKNTAKMIKNIKK